MVLKTILVTITLNQRPQKYVVHTISFQTFFVQAFKIIIDSWKFRRDSVRRGQHSSNRVSGISTRTIHQSTTPSLSQTIWPRWASRQFVTLPIVQTFLPVTFGYSLSSEAVIMRQLSRWKRLWQRSLTRSPQEDFHGAFQNLLEWYNNCIAAGGDYFEKD